MSDERRKSEADPLVAEVYKDLASERVPEHLDDKVLRMAAREGRTRYAVSRAWMRPTAWAATIALSLAIVMELTLLSGTEPEPAQGRIAPREAQPAVGEAAADLRQELADVPAARPEAKSEVRAKLEETPAPAKRSRAAARDDADAGLGTTEAFTPQSVSVVREAEELARMQAGPDRESVASEVGEREPAANIATTASFAARTDLKPAAPAEGCSSLARETAESWYQCIEDLRESGLAELADAEHVAFVEEFPDYMPAKPDK